MLIENEAAMLAVGCRFAYYCKPALVIYLLGELGAGKTTFTRGLLRGLGYQGRVKSPTYTLVEPYTINDWQLFHFDLYRIHDEQELELIGVRDYFHPLSICLIEWPQKGQSLLPAADISLEFEMKDQHRILHFNANTAQGDHILANFVGSQHD